MCELQRVGLELFSKSIIVYTHKTLFRKYFKLQMK